MVIFLLSQGADPNVKTIRQWELMTNMMKNSYPAGSKPMDLAKISLSNFSFNDHKAELKLIIDNLSEKK